MRDTIAMTVFNREFEVLLSTLRWLRACDLEDTEVIIVDDCSTIEYEWMEAYKKAIPTLRFIKMDPYECFHTPDGYKNPAKAFNRCLEEARGENIALISSDVIVPGHVLEAARKVGGKEAIYCPMTIDLGTGVEYCGPHRPFPMPWFIYTNTEKCRDAGGWDENYLLGLCYEDNDFLGRLCLEVGNVVFDWTAICWHQTHHQPAYEFDNEVIRQANDRNKKYTVEKWTGLPWGPPDMPAFAVERTRHESGNLMWVFKDAKEVYEKAKRETLSPFVTAKVKV